MNYIRSMKNTLKISGTFLFLTAIILIMSFKFIDINHKKEKEVFVEKGKIVKKYFVNKRGDIDKSIYDLFFDTKTAEYFIKLDECSVNKKELEKYLDKNVKIKAIKKEGLWDTDDPNVQSRIGTYLAIEHIEEIK